MAFPIPWHKWILKSRRTYLFFFWTLKKLFNVHTMKSKFVLITEIMALDNFLSQRGFEPTNCFHPAPFFVFPLSWSWYPPLISSALWKCFPTAGSLLPAIFWVEERQRLPAPGYLQTSGNAPASDSWVLGLQALPIGPVICLLFYLITSASRCYFLQIGCVGVLAWTLSCSFLKMVTKHLAFTVHLAGFSIWNLLIYAGT